MAFDQDSRRRTYELNFRPYPGLIVRCRKPSFGALDKLTNAVLVLGDDLSGEHLPGSARIKAWRKLFRAFADSLVSWGLSDNGYAVPATREGVLSQDHEFLLEVVRTWYAVVVQHQNEPSRPAPREDRPVVAEVEDDGLTGFEDELAALPVIDIADVPDGLVPA
jgi:hypothetical protein